MIIVHCSFLVKTVRQVRAGDAKLADVADYLARVGSKKSSLNQSHDFNDRAVIEAFEHVARRKVYAVVDRVERLQKQGATQEDAWNACSIDLCKASRVCHELIFYSIADICTDNQLACLKYLFEFLAGVKQHNINSCRNTHSVFLHSLF